jgi:hypothetical protein
MAFLLGGWLTFDGSRALIKGDYTTPGAGPHAGQLGPWAKVVSCVGLNPRGALMKSIHVGLGVLWLIGAIAYAIKPDFGRMLLLGLSVCTLWYLPFGTVLALAELLMLHFARN